MAIKAGQFLHDVHGFVIDRIQTGGVSSLNIPQEKIYELGNYQAVATIRDIPDLSFDLESTDVSTEVEALLHGATAPNSASNGTEYDFATTFPIDVISPFKSGNGAFDVVKGIAVPYLTLDSCTYRFGVKANATEQFTLRGDGVYYIPGSPYYQSFSLSGTSYTLTHNAIPYTESGNTLYVLGACVKNVSTGLYKRLTYGTGANGYTHTGANNITLGTAWGGAGYTTLHVVYGSGTAAAYAQSTNASTSVKPAAIRAKDVLVYVGTSAATSSLVRWSGVQQVEITRKVNLQNDEELGNTHYVSTDYDVPDVNGSLTVKSADATDLWALVAQVAGVNASGAIAGPISAPAVALRILVRDPDSGLTLKTWEIPDAKFTLPGSQGRVQQKLEVQFPFASDSGSLSVFKADPA